MAQSYILHIASWFPNQYSPFNGDFVERHIQSLDKYQNIVLHCHVGKEVVKNELQIKKESYAENWIYLKKLSTTSVFPLAQSKALKKGVSKIIAEKGKPLLIHIHVMQYACLVIPFLKKKYKLPLVVTEHSTLFSASDKSWSSKLKTSLCQKYSRQADYIFPVSDQLKKSLSDLGFQNKQKVIYNVVPDYFFESIRSKNKIVQFLHVSSLKNDHKNIEGMARSFYHLRECGKNFHLTIIGNENLEETNKTFDKIGLDKKCYTIKGPVKHTQIAKEMAKSDVFVLFSNYENYPCVLIEAQASGLQLVATDVGGVSEILGDEDFLISAKDENGLGKALTSILNNPNETDKSGIRQMAKNKYSNKVIGKQIEKIYQELI